MFITPEESWHLRITDIHGWAAGRHRRSRKADWHPRQDGHIGKSAIGNPHRESLREPKCWFWQNLKMSELEDFDKGYLSRKKLKWKSVRCDVFYSPKVHANPMKRVLGTQRISIISRRLTVQSVAHRHRHTSVVYRSLISRTASESGPGGRWPPGPQLHLRTPL